MKKFVIKTVILITTFLVVIELVSRLLLDPIYFHATNTYNLKFDKSNLRLDGPGFNLLHFKNTAHVDYLFIGSSRIPATINPSVIIDENPGKIAVVAGRGYMTPGIHYQALLNRVTEYPDYLKGAKVFIEYPGSNIYASSFAEDKLKVFEPVVATEKAMPHLLLPHLTWGSLLSFLKESKNSFSVKLEMVALFFVSSYRTSTFIKEKFARLEDYQLVKQDKAHLVSEGGIRNDNIKMAQRKAIEVAAIEAAEIVNSPALTMSKLDSSSLCHIHDLIVKNGGTLLLYKMPLSTLQENIHKSKQALQNKKVFEEWIAAKGIEVIENNEFRFQDADFPDTWHLSESRRDEFTRLLYKEIVEHQNQKEKQIQFSSAHNGLAY